jgi:hypothetical protein
LCFKSLGDFIDDPAVFFSGIVPNANRMAWESFFEKFIDDLL